MELWLRSNSLSITEYMNRRFVDQMDLNLVISDLFRKVSLNHSCMYTNRCYIEISVKSLKKTILYFVKCSETFIYFLRTAEIITMVIHGKAMNSANYEKQKNYFKWNDNFRKDMFWKGTIILNINIVNPIIEWQHYIL